MNSPKIRFVGVIPFDSNHIDSPTEKRTAKLRSQISFMGVTRISFKGDFDSTEFDFYQL